MGALNLGFEFASGPSCDRSRGVRRLCVVHVEALDR